MLTKSLVMHRLMADVLADGPESGGIVNNLTFALWITGIRLGDFGFWGEKKNEYARWCLSGGLWFAYRGYLSGVCLSALY
jgi:hypothetical protein